jgi:hypothetical protein
MIGDGRAAQLIKAIIDIATAQKEGRVASGIVCGIRYNSADKQTPHDIQTMAREIESHLTSVQTAFKILEAKARNRNKETEARGEMWDRLGNIAIQYPGLD